MKEHLTPEQDIIYSIVEQWGNAACGPQIMEGWLKKYAEDKDKENERLKGLIKTAINHGMLCSNADQVESAYITFKLLYDIG